VSDKQLICTRCADPVDQDEFFIEDSPIKLNIQEISFIRSRFSEPLCAACLNQLKTTYKILHGDYDVRTGSLVK
jgi:hypothetical protein